MCSVIIPKASVILAFKFVISGTGVENTLSLTYPHKKKSRGVISGDLGGQGVGPSLPIHLFGNFASKNRRTCEPQFGGAPSCWKIIHGWNSSNWGATWSFLIINVCNQGKNLCSPCIFLEYWRFRVSKAACQPAAYCDIMKCTPLLHLWDRIWRQYFLPKQLYISVTLHGLIPPIRSSRVSV